MCEKKGSQLLVFNTLDVDAQNWEHSFNNNEIVFVSLLCCLGVTGGNIGQQFVATEECNKAEAG